MFKITIEEIKDVKKTIGKRWETVAQEWPEQGFDRIGRMDASGTVTINISAKDVKGYTPEVESTETVSSKIYEQTVDELDVADVIAVINGLRSVG